MKALRNILQNLGIIKKSNKCICQEKKNSVGISIKHHRSKFNIDFEITHSLEFFDILKCKDCGTNWIQEKEDNIPIAQRIKSDKEYTFLDEWIKHDKDGESFMPMLKEIGIIDFKRLEVPCSCVLKSGQKIDCCIFYKSPIPPMLEYTNLQSKRIIYTDEVESIDFSKYGLNRDYRYALRNAREFNNGYYPVFLMISEELYFKYIGNMLFSNLFFKYEKYDASSIISTNQDFKKYTTPTNHDLVEYSLLLCDRV